MHGKVLCLVPPKDPHAPPVWQVGCLEFLVNVDTVGNAHRLMEPEIYISQWTITPPEAPMHVPIFSKPLSY